MADQPATAAPCGRCAVPANHNGAWVCAWPNCERAPMGNTDDVMAALSRLLDLQMQHGQVEGAIEFLTGLDAERIKALGGVPDGT